MMRQKLDTEGGLFTVPQMLGGLSLIIKNIDACPLLSYNFP